MATDLRSIPWYLKYHKNVDLVLGIKNMFKLEGVFKFKRLQIQISEEVSTHVSRERTDIEAR